MYVCAAMHIAKNQRNEVFKTYLQFHKIPTEKKNNITEFELIKLSEK